MRVERCDARVRTVVVNFVVETRRRETAAARREDEEPGRALARETRASARSSSRRASHRSTIFED